jgi:signal transduction histidine kinase
MTTAPQVPGTVRRVDVSVWERLRRVDHRIWDGGLAAAAVVFGVVGFLLRETRPDEIPAAVGLTLMVVAGVSLAWRRRAPLTVAVVVGACASIATVAGYWPEFVFLLWIALYSAAAYGDRSRLWTTLAPVAVVASVATSVGEHAERGVNWVEIVSELVLTAGVPILLGRMTANRHRRIARDREIAARDAVSDERARIARELHDVVAHHMSVMVVQAGAARTVAATDPAAADAALRQIEDSGRTGLGEMRRLLEILKADPDGDGLTPQPGLERLGSLLEEMRAAGLPVELAVEGAERPLPPGVDLSAFRIVQEALTNALKHAGRASASVRLRYAPDALEVEVADDGVGPPSDGVNGHGHGLIGMRERAALFGGSFESRARAGGGFSIRARLPTP